MRGLSPNVEPQNSFEPNSSIFSTSLAARSVVADAAAKHPTVHELVLQQKKRAQEVHAGKHGPSSFGHAKGIQVHLIGNIIADLIYQDLLRRETAVSERRKAREGPRPQHVPCLVLVGVHQRHCRRRGSRHRRLHQLRSHRHSRSIYFGSFAFPLFM